MFTQQEKTTLMDTSLIDMDDELRQSIPKASDLKNSQTVQDHMNDIIKKDKIKGCFLARSLRQKYLLLPNKLRSHFHKLYLFRSH